MTTTSMKEVAKKDTIINDDGEENENENKGEDEEQNKNDNGKEI